jgi:pimeloyl-ACP methyl ester carboxylesterase
VIRLPDGRSLGLSEFGDPAGRPVFYMHGWPASRLEAALLPGIRVRLIAVDRPGYGASDPKPGRTMLDVAADVADAADQLGLRRFAVAGVSGGGAYALACARALPGRVTSAAIMSAVPPPDTPGLGGDLSRLMRLGRNPVAGRAVLTLGRALFRSGRLRPPVLDGRGLLDGDLAVMTPQMAGLLADAWLEGLRRGISGALSDARLYARPWGFAFSEITVPVGVWHGGQDTIVPVATTSAFDALPNAVRKVLAGEGHYSLALRHGHEALESLAD